MRRREQGAQSTCAPHRLWRALSGAHGSRVLLGLELLALYALYGFHPFVITTWASVDDGLYVQQAMGFLKWLRGTSESWLGGFDCFLLAKAPLYGLWLAFLNLLGLPLRVGDFLLLLAGPFLFRQALKPVRELRAWEFAIVLFLLLANPFIPQDFYLRRLTFHIALTNLCIVAAVGLALRAQATLASQTRWALLLGFVFSLCYLNREEAVWLSAAIAVTLLILWTSSFLAWRRKPAVGRQALRGHAIIVLVLLGGALPLILAVCALNRRDYGVFTTTFRRSSALTNLVQRLTSLEPAGHQAYVPIARPTRLKAYALSPSFAQLQRTLDGKSGYWRAGNPEHAALNGRKPEEQELFVSYFEFCLLWAAKESGAKRGHQIEALFRDIDRELTQAVRDKQIEAGSPGPATLAAPIPGDYRRIAAAFWMALSPLLFVGNPGYQWPAIDSTKASRKYLDEAGWLTLSWVTPEPLPDLKYQVREPIVRRIKQAQTLIFPLCCLATPALVIWRRREAFTLEPSPRGLLLWSLLVPVVSLAAFCLSMALVEVLGFKFLAGMGYDVLGYSPLTVLCALAFAGTLVFCLPHRSPASAMQDGPSSECTP